MAGSPAAAEQRKAVRIPVALHAHCQVGTRYLREPITDLSVGGFYLRTREPLRPGTPVRAALALPSTEGPRYCTVVGSVARVAHDDRGTSCGVGVAFAREEITATDWKTLERFVREASLGPARRASG